MKTTNPMLEQPDEIIARVGWMVQAVFHSPDAPGFAYTVGLAAKGLPELVSFSLPPNVAVVILNRLAQQLVNGESLEVGKALDHVMQDYDCMLLETGREQTDQYMFQTLHRYPDYRALQLIWQDPLHRWPWDEAYDKAYAQPLLKPKLH